MKRTSALDAELLKNIPTAKKPKIKAKNLFNFLFMAFILGVLYGSVLVREDVNVFFDKLALINDVSLLQKSTQSLLATFMQTFFSTSIFFVIIFLMGSSCIGQIASFLVIFAKGLGIGGSIGYLYLNYGVQGLGYSALIILPTTIIVVFSLILIAKESIKLSNLILMGFVKDSCKLSLGALKLYLYKSAILYAFVIAASLVDCLMTFLFARLFSF